MTRKCKVCNTQLPKHKDSIDIFHKKRFCGISCLSEHGKAKAQEARERKARAKHREDKKRVRRRSEWLDMLQDVVNQYVLHIRDADEPCFTCGTNKPDIKYDAGHCFTRAARPDIRFELTNIHKQCSVNCNQQHSGRQGEHKARIAEKYGSDHLAKLEDQSQWPLLKDQLPDWQSIEAEIKRYRELIRSYGLTPRR